MLAGFLLPAILFMPIYHWMQAAAGSNVVTASSQRNPVTGAIALTPMTADATGALKPAAEVLPYKDLPTFIADPIAWKLILLIFLQVIFVTMVYGPIAAYLVEAFPAKIRYTALSLPYHIGAGVFGGLLPLIGLYVVAATGNIYAGLYYPIVVASISFVIGAIFLKETHNVMIWKEVDHGPAGSASLRREKVHQQTGV
jgi:hypothetical protein